MKRNLTLARLNETDLNDKLGLLSDVTQNLDDRGVMSLDALDGVAVLSPQLSPTIVAANSESTQTFTVNGLRVGDAVIVVKPTKQANLSVGDSYVASGNTLSITFRNFSGGGITPTANERYVIVAMRKP